MARVLFQRRRSPVRVEVPQGLSVLEAARLAGVPLANSCGGEGACKACRIEVLAGADGISPAEPRECDALAAVGAGPSARLACAARVLGEVTITTGYW